jgi:hypothetical protein
MKIEENGQISRKTERKKQKKCGSLMQKKPLFMSKKDEKQAAKKEPKNAEKQIKMVYRQ